MVDVKEIEEQAGLTIGPEGTVMTTKKINEGIQQDPIQCKKLADTIIDSMDDKDLDEYARSTMYAHLMDRCTPEEFAQAWKEWAEEEREISCCGIDITDNDIKICPKCLEHC